MRNAECLGLWEWFVTSVRIASFCHIMMMIECGGVKVEWLEVLGQLDLVGGMDYCRELTSVEVNWYRK
jgi:hypothetical protein